MKARYLLLFFLFTPAILQAQETEASDTITRSPINTQFKLYKLILPTSLIAAGTWGICNGWAQSVNHTIRNKMVDLQDGHSFHADDYIQYLPIIANIGLGTIGAKARHSFKERLIITTTSYLAMGIMVNGIKLTINEKRPDSSAKNSFPSGHTATVFMGAELVRMEYGHIYGISSYFIAGSVAFLRLYNNRHWLNDILAGAGIGILSARIGYWLLPVNKRIFGLNKRKNSMILACPFYDYPGKKLGATFSIQF